MNIQYHKSQATERPVELDTESSKVAVIIRKNIKEVSKVDPETQQTETYFEYDEAILTKEEYIIYQESLETQLAIAELAEALLGD